MTLDNPTIEIVNRSTDRPYGVTRYRLRCPGFNYEFDITDIDKVEIPQKTKDYILSTLITTKY